MFNKNKPITRSRCRVTLACNTLSMIIGIWALISAASGRIACYKLFGFSSWEARIEGGLLALYWIMGILIIGCSLLGIYTVMKMLDYMDKYNVNYVTAEEFKSVISANFLQYLSNIFAKDCDA